MNRKSIVLNGIEDQSKRAVLTLENDGDMLSGRLRLYNFGIEPKGIISLGIYYNGNVVKAGLTHSSGMLFTFKSQMKILPEKFSCAVVNFTGGEATPILYGNSDGYCDREEVFKQVITNLSTTKNMSDVENVLDKYGVDFDDEEKQEIENVISQNLSEEDKKLCDDDCFEHTTCKNCKYKDFYYSHFQEDKEPLIEDEKVIPEVKFYKEMEEQIEKLFKENPNEEYLENLLPNSKWVKVSIGENGDYYVLGLIYDENIIKYICYGVPGVYQKVPPRELSGYPIWFPLEKDKPQGFGYWLSYQDADSGESVKAVVV